MSAPCRYAAALFIAADVAACFIQIFSAAYAAAAAIFRYAYATLIFRCLPFRCLMPLLLRTLIFFHYFAADFAAITLLSRFFSPSYAMIIADVTPCC